MRKPLYFHMFCLGLASENEKWHLANPLARACRVCLYKSNRNIPNG